MRDIARCFSIHSPLFSNENSQIVILSYLLQLKYLTWKISLSLFATILGNIAYWIISRMIKKNLTVERLWQFYYDVNFSQNQGINICPSALIYFKNN